MICLAGVVARRPLELTKTGVLSWSGRRWAPKLPKKRGWEKYRVFRLQSVCGRNVVQVVQVFQGSAPMCPTQSRVCERRWCTLRPQLCRQWESPLGPLFYGQSQGLHWAHHDKYQEQMVYLTVGG